LVVVLIIGILAGVAFPLYQRIVQKSRFSNAFVIGRAVKDAAERYYLTNGYYPSSTDELDITFKCPENFRCGLRTGNDASFAIGNADSSLHFVFSFDHRTTRNGTTPLAGLIYCTALVGDDFANGVCSTYFNRIFYTDTHNKYKLN
jgi:type IV pilus assembly protein PilE